MIFLKLMMVSLERLVGDWSSELSAVSLLWLVVL